jgi:uncharacterized protein DUF4203
MPIDRNLYLIGALLSVAFGIISCFFGYRVFRLVLAFLGFFLGAAIGVSLVASNHSLLLSLLAGLVGGLIGAAALYLLYTIGVFIAGIAFGATIATAFLAVLNANTSPLVHILVIGGGALVGGILAVMFNRLIIILGTAFGGAASIVYGVALLIPNFAPITNPRPGVMSESLVAMVIWLVLAALGAVYQYRESEKAQASLPAV